MNCTISYPQDDPDSREPSMNGIKPETLLFGHLGKPGDLCTGEITDHIRACPALWKFLTIAAWWLLRPGRARF
jgi:hypothetical protein